MCRRESRIDGRGKHVWGGEKDGDRENIEREGKRPSRGAKSERERIGNGAEKVRR